MHNRVRNGFIDGPSWLTFLSFNVARVSLCSRWRWTKDEEVEKKKRIMLHIKRFIFLHGMVNTKRCLDAFIIGASFGCLCHCLLPKTNFKMHKNAFFLPTSSQLSRFSFINTDATNNLQNIQHTCNIHLQWGFHLGILHFSSIGVLLYYRKKKEVLKYIQKGKQKEKKNRKQEVFNLNPVPQRTNKTSSTYVALIQTTRKFTTLVFPHLINVTKVLHYKIGQL